LIEYEVTKDFKNSTFSSIVTLLEDSLNSKPKIQTQAAQISRYFSLTILSLAFSTFLVWYFFGLDLGFIYEGTNQFERSFIVAVPVMCATTFYDVYKHHAQILQDGNFINLAVGFVTSFVVAYLVIKLFLKFLERFTFVAFGIYRIIFGVLILLLF
jgi:hypothetical protein